MQGLPGGVGVLAAADQPADEPVMAGQGAGQFLPQGVHGEYSVELTLRINETGGIEQMSVSKSSGKAEVDNAVLTGVIREGVIPPRPAGSEPLTMRLLFTLKNN